MGKQKAQTKVKPTGVPTTKEKQDEAIIGTNDYSIVSKRSVEKLYYTDEPEFLRPFVARFKRRAPLINRGYWLRMKAIENSVANFLDEKSEKSKVIVNLGCGYEPLPFRMLWKYSKLCRNVKFVDVDYPQLMLKKTDVIRRDSLFSNLLSGEQRSSAIGSSSLLLLNDEKYCAVGCDLGNTEDLDRALRTELQLDSRSILFIGEVSIVYMEVEQADRLVRWAGTFKDARFCLLEQHLPAGADHPFAQTMLAHFQKQTPLRCLTTYPTIKDQDSRFLSAGWSDVDIRSLWSLWQDPNFAPGEKIAVDAVEPFDEWEELALFSGHYFLLIATTSGVSGEKRNLQNYRDHFPGYGILNQTSQDIAIRAQENPRGQGLRRFGAVLDSGDHIIEFHGGLTSTTRQGSCDFYTSSPNAKQLTSITRETNSHEVTTMCHTITTTDNGSAVLIGGRNSPAKASSLCWLYRNREHGWVPTASLSTARYRHCSAPVKTGATCGILVFGGRTSTADTLDTWSFFDTKFGWRELEPPQPHPGPLFGASMVATGERSGILIGGMHPGGILSAQYWGWELIGEREDLSIRLQSKLGELENTQTDPQVVMRFGASLVRSEWGLLLIGGVGVHGPLDVSEEILVFRMNGRVESFGNLLQSDVPKLLLVGCGATTIEDGNVLIVGGSAVCFSFGAFWNEHSYLICPNNEVYTLPSWRLANNILPTQSTGREGDEASWKAQPSQEMKEMRTLKHATPIPRMRLDTSETFQRLLADANPAVVEGLDLGPCTRLWTSDYLRDKIGPDRSVIIHSASSPHMSFHEKNFTYDKIPFDRFIDSAMGGSHVYLRALSSSNPNKLPASLETDFPSIAKDFHIPSQLRIAKENKHSSVLRISGKMVMWLHYDVMANILCQIRGSKRVVLFPPSDVSRLGFPAGETTSNLSVFTAEEGEFAGTHPIETVLKEGDVLFIPACWPHATAPAAGPAGDGGSVAVNVFFRHLEGGYAAGRDVYGNRDLEMYQYGRRDVARLIALFEGCKKDDVEEEVEALVRGLRGGCEVDWQPASTQGARIVGRVTKSMEVLPAGIKGFYSSRLADELCAGVLGKG